MRVDNPNLSDQERDCIDACLAAVEGCEWCADGCLDEDGTAECIRLCRDVVDIASLHARLTARGSPRASELAELCASICEACAEECAQHDHDHCRACADVLPECAEACRSLA